MNKQYKQFINSKDALQHKPIKWHPNTFLDTYNEVTGKFRSRRKYGKDGFAYKDMDTADLHRPYDHIHDWQDQTRSKTPRNPNKQEKKEFKKAKRKRRFK